MEGKGPSRQIESVESRMTKVGDQRRTALCGGILTELLKRRPGR